MVTPNYGGQRCRTNREYISSSAQEPRKWHLTLSRRKRSKRNECVKRMNGSYPANKKGTFREVRGKETKEENLNLVALTGGHFSPF